MNAFLEIPALPPRTIVLNPPLSDEEFERMSEQCVWALWNEARKEPLS